MLEVSAAGKPIHSFWSVIVLLVAGVPALSQEKSPSRLHLADYNSELRGPAGRVDTDAMVQRLKDLGVTTFYWLVWHAATDWDDLKVFLPKAAQAGIEVWVYLVPPSESPPNYGTQYSEPFRLAYLQDREEIERTWAILNDATLPPASELSHPWDTPSRAGDYVMVGQSAKVLSADRYEVRFLQRDDFGGPTAGYHYKQLLVDGTVVWEEDVAGGSSGWCKVAVDVTERVRGKTGISLAFRLLDKKGVSNFGVQWCVKGLRGENLQLAADLSELPKWKVSRQGAFETGFGVSPKLDRELMLPRIAVAHQFPGRCPRPAVPGRSLPVLPGARWPGPMEIGSTWPIPTAGVPSGPLPVP